MWLEWSKIEEEAGNYRKAKKIVDRGLDVNPLADTLAIRAIKLAERLGDHRAVRNVMGLVRRWEAEKSWKAMSEVRRLVNNCSRYICTVFTTKEALG